MKPIIGLFATVDSEKTTIATNTYVKALAFFGGIPIILPYTNNSNVINNYVSLCDGFLFTGGNDVEPLRYGEQIVSDKVIIERYRDEFEFNALSVIIPTYKPILGICRGCQVINVYFGGTLYQDILSEIKTKIAHSQKEEKFEYSHDINVVKNTPLYDLFGGVKKLRGNSFHHQSIKKLGNNLKVMATADDGVVEGAYFDGFRYIRLYQWHVERLFDKDNFNAQIIKDFINACKHK